jgi:type IV secretion system protein VirB2
MTKKTTTGKTTGFFVPALAVLTVTAILLSVDAAFATNISTTVMPWEAGLKLLITSITGPVATAISLIAIVAAGAALIFGGDMTGFMRTAVYIVLVLGIIVSAAGLLSALYTTASVNLPYVADQVEQAGQFLF